MGLVEAKPPVQLGALILKPFILGRKLSHQGDQCLSRSLVMAMVRVSSGLTSLIRFLISLITTLFTALFMRIVMGRVTDHPEHGGLIRVDTVLKAVVASGQFGPQHALPDVPANGADGASQRSGSLLNGQSVIKVSLITLVTVVTVGGRHTGHR